MSTPRISEEPLYLLLRDEKVAAFNQHRKKGADVDLSGCDFRGLDLRGLNPDGLDLSGAYFRNADLRGIDFRKTRLEGASIAAAQISGCYFPQELPAEEVMMSISHGTRMRYR